MTNVLIVQFPYPTSDLNAIQKRQNTIRQLTVYDSTLQGLANSSTIHSSPSVSPLPSLQPNNHSPSNSQSNIPSNTTLPSIVDSSVLPVADLTEASSNASTFIEKADIKDLLVAQADAMKMEGLAIADDSSVDSKIIDNYQLPHVNSEPNLTQIQIGVSLPHYPSTPNLNEQKTFPVQNPNLTYNVTTTPNSSLSPQQPIQYNTVYQQYASQPTHMPQVGYSTVNYAPQPQLYSQQPQPYSYSTHPYQYNQVPNQYTVAQNSQYTARQSPHPYQQLAIQQLYHQQQPKMPLQYYQQQPHFQPQPQYAQQQQVPQSYSQAQYLQNPQYAQQQAQLKYPPQNYQYLNHHGQSSVSSISSLNRYLSDLGLTSNPSRVTTVPVAYNPVMTSQYGAGGNAQPLRTNLGANNTNGHSCYRIVHPNQQRSYSQVPTGMTQPLGVPAAVGNVNVIPTTATIKPKYERKWLQHMVLEKDGCTDPEGLSKIFVCY